MKIEAHCLVVCVAEEFLLGFSKPQFSVQCVTPAFGELCQHVASAAHNLISGWMRIYKEGLWIHLEERTVHIVHAHRAFYKRELIKIICFMHLLK